MNPDDRFPPGPPASPVTGTQTPGAPAGGFGAGGPSGDFGPMTMAPSQTPYVLAASSAFLAAGYWGLLALLTGFSAFAGGTTGVQAIMPVVLVFLYIGRGVRVWKGDLRSMRSLMWLHGLGMFGAVLGIATGGSLIVAGLHGMKIAIHIFGLIVTYRAKKQAKAFGSGLLPTT